MYKFTIICVILLLLLITIVATVEIIWHSVMNGARFSSANYLNPNPNPNSKSTYNIECKFSGAVERLIF